MALPEHAEFVLEICDLGGGRKVRAISSGIHAWPGSQKDAVIAAATVSRRKAVKGPTLLIYPAFSRGISPSALSRVTACNSVSLSPNLSSGSSVSPICTNG